MTAPTEPTPEQLDALREQFRKEFASAEYDPAPEEKAPTDDRGRLVLATGLVVAVPAEGVSVATSHYDPNVGATVPVVAAFVLTKD
jgi:hypothetical protein